MKRHAMRTLVALLAAAVTVQAHAWEIVTQHVETKWYKHRAMDLLWNCKTNWQNANGDGFRPTSIDIRYDQDTYGYYGYTYVVAPCVRNVGAHKKTWTFLYDKTPQQIADAAEAGDYTVVDFEEYKEDGVIKYAALLEKFAQKKSYFIYAQTNSNWLNGYVGGSGGKIVDMDVDDFGNATLHGAINFGVTTYGVTWDSTMTWEQIADYLDSSGKRLLDLQRWSQGYCALFCDEKAGEAGNWSYFGNASWSWIQDVEDDGWRIHTVNSQLVNGEWRYTGVLVWNG